MPDAEVNSRSFPKKKPKKSVRIILSGREYIFLRK